MLGSDVDWTIQTVCNVYTIHIYSQQFAVIVFAFSQESMCIAGFSSLARTRVGTGSTFS